MKKIGSLFLLLILFFTLTSCSTPSLEPMGGQTMSFYIGQTGEFDEGYTYQTEDTDIIELNGNSYKTLKEGSAVVTVRDGNEKIGVYLIAVYGSKPIVLETLQITNKPTTLTVNEQVKLEYSKNPVDANDFEAIIWESSNEEIATIDKYGIITPLKMGEVTISISAINTDIKAEVSLTVLPRNTIFELNYSKIVGVSGNVEKVLEKDVLTDYPFDGKVTWFTEDDSIVSVSQDGTTYFKNPGTTNVGIKAMIDNKEVIYKCNVTVLEDLGYEVIRTPEDLQAIGNFSGNYMLGNDIDMKEATSKGGDLYNDGKGFMPLFEDSKNAFEGIFDGNGFTIYNMYINRPNDAFVAFMRYISAKEGKEGLIKRLSFVGGEINGGNYTSVFYANSVGYGSVDSGLRDSYAEIKLTSIGSLSGLVGNNKGLVQNCIANVTYDVIGDMYLFALNHTGTEAGIGIDNCIFIGDYADREEANLENGGFVSNCHKLSVEDIKEFEFNLGSNWVYTEKEIPVVKGVSYE